MCGHFRTIVIAAIFPIIASLSIHYGVGGSIKDLSFGFVNNEDPSMQQCFNKSLVSTVVEGYDCTLNKVSCKFIELFDSSDNHIETVWMPSSVGIN